jgi:hypothetical protein
MGGRQGRRGLRALASSNLPFSPDECRRRLPIVKNLSPKIPAASTIVCPVSVEGDVLTVAHADPLNPVIVDDLRQSPASPCKSVVARRGDPRGHRPHLRSAATAAAAIVEGMGRIDGADGDEDDQPAARHGLRGPGGASRETSSIENAERRGLRHPHRAVRGHAPVRYRIDGILYDLEAPPRRLQAAVTSRSS